MYHIKFITITLKPIFTTHACHPSPGEAEIQKSLQIQGHSGLQSGVLSHPSVHTNIKQATIEQSS